MSIIRKRYRTPLSRQFLGSISPTRITDDPDSSFEYKLYINSKVYSTTSLEDIFPSLDFGGAGRFAYYTLEQNTFQKFDEKDEDKSIEYECTLKAFLKYIKESYCDNRDQKSI